MGIVVQSRRQFLRGSVALVGVVLLWGCGRSLPWAQQPTKVHRIGILSPDSPENVASTVAQTLQALAGFGYVEGQNLVVERRFGVSEAQLRPVTSELLAAGVDLLLPLSTPAALAAKAATTSIPIVVVSSDPVGAGLVESLARP